MKSDPRQYQGKPLLDLMVDLNQRDAGDIVEKWQVTPDEKKLPTLGSIMQGESTGYLNTFWEKKYEPEKKLSLKEGYGTK
jgi:hypothetical protein